MKKTNARITSVYKKRGFAITRGSSGTASVARMYEKIVPAIVAKIGVNKNPKRA